MARENVLQKKRIQDGNAIKFSPWRPRLRKFHAILHQSDDAEPPALPCMADEAHTRVFTPKL
jgi:hypothetical protein